MFIFVCTGILSSSQGTSVTGVFGNDLYPAVDLPRYQLYFTEVPKEIIQTQIGLTPEVRTS